VIDHRDEIAATGPATGISPIAVYGRNQINASAATELQFKSESRSVVGWPMGGRREIVRDNVTFYDVTFDLLVANWQQRRLQVLSKSSPNFSCKFRAPRLQNTQNLSRSQPNTELF
jgi:hypothetical protein